MYPGPDTTPTLTNCLRRMQWNANGISGKITELLSFLHSNNVNIAAIQETKQANKTKPLKTPGLAAVRIDRHKNKGGGLLMLTRDTTPFVDKTVAHPHSADPHLEQQGISVTMPNRHQLHIHNIYIPPRSSCSASHNASIAHALSNNDVSLIVGDVISHNSRWDSNKNKDERGEQLVVEIDANGRSTSPDISLASIDIALPSDWLVPTSLASDHLSIIITINSKLSHLMGLGEPISTSRKQTGHAMLKLATNTLLKLAKQELSNMPRRPSGKQ